MNDKLRTIYDGYKGADAVLGDQVVRFDGNGNSKGIVRYAGQPPLDEPKPINNTTLDEARKYPNLFIVDDEKTEKNEAHPRAKKKGVETVAVEVPDTKAVIDVPVEVQ